MAKLYSFPTENNPGDLRCMAHSNIVCPFCSMVWKDGKLYGSAYDFDHTLEDWVAYGYELKACPKCTKASKYPGGGNELQLMIDMGLSHDEIQRRIVAKYEKSIEKLNKKLNKGG